MTGLTSCCIYLHRLCHHFVLYGFPGICHEELLQNLDFPVIGFPAGIDPVHGKLIGDQAVGINCCEGSGISVLDGTDQTLGFIAIEGSPAQRTGILNTAVGIRRRIVSIIPHTVNLAAGLHGSDDIVQHRVVCRGHAGSGAGSIGVLYLRLQGQRKRGLIGIAVYVSIVFLHDRLYIIGICDTPLHLLICKGDPGSILDRRPELIASAPLLPEDPVAAACFLLYPFYPYAAVVFLQCHLLGRSAGGNGRTDGIQTLVNYSVDIPVSPDAVLISAECCRIPVCEGGAAFLCCTADVRPDSACHRPSSVDDVPVRSFHLVPGDDILHRLQGFCLGNRLLQPDPDRRRGGSAGAEIPFS